MLHSAHSVRAGATRLRPPPFQLPSGLALRDLAIDRDVLELVPRSVAEECCVLPVAFNGETLTCVTPRADDVMTQDKLRFILNCDVYFIPRDAQEVRRAIAHHYRALPAESADSMLQEFTDTAIDFTETVDTDAWEDDCMMEEWAPEPWQRSSARVPSPVAIVPPHAQERR